MTSAYECDNDPVANFTEVAPMCMNFKQIFIFLSNTPPWWPDDGIFRPKHVVISE